MLPPGGLFLMLALASMLARRHPKRARGLALATLGTLWLLSTPWISFLLFSSLMVASPLPPSDLVQLKVDAIVVLGGGLRADCPEYAEPQPTLPSLERLRYGLWVQQRLSVPLVLSSGNTDPTRSSISEAEAMARVARAQQPGQGGLMLEERSLTTWENARECARLLLPQGMRRVLLVTEGFHMRRARQCFVRAGFEVVAAPVGLIKAGRFERGVFAWIPSYAALNRSSLALEELLGNLVYALRALFE